MPKRISKETTDPNTMAFQIVQAATTESEPVDREMLSRVMAEMGRKGGKIGGKKSLETMTRSQRKKRAQKAAQARWKKPAK